MKLFCLAMVCLVATQSCIYTDQRKRMATSSPSAIDEGWNYVRANELEIKSFIYRPSKLPLERFFSRLTSGEITEALIDIDINYDRRNFSNEAIKKLIDNGFVPAFVVVENKSNNEVSFDPEKFLLNENDNIHLPIENEELPGFFSEFHIAAVGANIYNVAVVTSSVVVLMAASIAICQKGCRGPDRLDFSKDNIFNSTEKLIEIDYRDHLLKKMVLKPGEQIGGLLFFKIENSGLDWDDFRLTYNP